MQGLPGCIWALGGGKAGIFPSSGLHMHTGQPTSPSHLNNRLKEHLTTPKVISLSHWVLVLRWRQAGSLAATGPL